MAWKKCKWMLEVGPAAGSVTRTPLVLPPMKLHGGSITLLAALTLSAWGSALGGPGASPMIPATNGRLLSGDPVQLPSALTGRTGVLVLGFSQASRTQVTAWGRRLAGDYAGSDRVQYFELPVLAAVPRLLRGLVLSKVKDGVPQRAWPHCLPVVDHEAEWKSAVDFHDADTAYVVVVDGQGKVQARLTGDATDANYAVVKAQVEAAHPR